MEYELIEEINRDNTNIWLLCKDRLKLAGVDNDNSW